MRPRRTLYGWLAGPGRYCLGKNPPDTATPFELFSSMSEAERTAMERKSNVIWSGAALAEKETRNANRKAVL